MEPEKKQRGQVLGEFGIVIFFSLLYPTEAALQTIDNPSHLETLLGQNVRLPCVVTDSDKPQLNLDPLTASVRWDMRSLNGSQRTVYLLSNRIHEAYRSKSSIDESEFIRGIASLSMWEVLQGDEGEYTCTVYVRPHILTAKISLQVSAKPNVTLTSYEVTVELGHERSVICNIDKFYPKLVMIRWFRSSKGSKGRKFLDKETCNSVPAENIDGTFSGTSIILVKPSSTNEDGDIYSCTVTHRSFNNDQAVKFILRVKEETTSSWVRTIVAVAVLIGLLLLGTIAVVCYKKDLKISRITGADYVVHRKPSTLIFSILVWKAKSLDINVYLKRVKALDKLLIGSCKYCKEQPGHQNSQNTEMQPLNREPVGEADSLKVTFEPPQRSFILYRIPCTLQITPDIETDDGAELSVQVKHSALKYHKLQKCTLKFMGDGLRLSPTTTQKHLIYGEEATLTCIISKYSPGPLQIVWLKKDLMNQQSAQVICKKGSTTDDRYSHTHDQHKDGCLFTCSSSLTFRANVREDHMKQYTCRVHYQAFNQNMQSTFNTYVRAVPEVTPITSKPEIPSAGQQVTLSCNILSFHPREVTVNWYKKDDLVLETEHTVRKDDDLLYSVISTLKTTCEMKDFETTFTCKVFHESIQEPKIQEWTLNFLKTQLSNTQEEGQKATVRTEEPEDERNPLPEPVSL